MLLLTAVRVELDVMFSSALVGARRLKVGIWIHDAQHAYFSTILLQLQLNHFTIASIEFFTEAVIKHWIIK